MRDMASDPFFYVVLASMLVVFGILVFGIGTFGRGGEFNRRNANKIMRWRVGSQAVAIVLIMLYILLRGGN